VCCRKLFSVSHSKTICSLSHKESTQPCLYLYHLHLMETQLKVPIVRITEGSNTLKSVSIRSLEHYSVVNFARIMVLFKCLLYENNGKDNHRGQIPVLQFCYFPCPPVMSLICCQKFILIRISIPIKSLCQHTFYALQIRSDKANLKYTCVIVSCDSDCILLL
jgi:hypothetical protein